MKNLKHNKKALVLLIGEVLDDPRVWKTSRSLANQGIEVTVACTNMLDRAGTEIVEGISIVRFPKRKESIVKSTFTLADRFFPSAKLAAAREHEKTASADGFGKIKKLVQKMNADHYYSSSMKICGMMVKRLGGEQFDIVHANDMDTLAAGAELKAKGAARALVYDAHEYWPGIGTGDSPAVRTASEMESRHIGDADHVVTVNDMIAELLKDRYSLSEMPSVVMNCPIKGTADPPLKRHGISGSENPVDCPRVLYQGKLQNFRGIEELVLAFKSVSEGTLVLSGYGPLEEGLKRLVKKEKLGERVEFKGRFRGDEAVEIASRCHIGIVPFPNITLNMYYAAPNKLFDYMAAGLAVISSDLPFVGKLISEYSIGATYEGRDPENIASVIDSIITDRQKLETYRRNSLKAAVDKFNWEEQFKNYPWLP